MDLTTWRTALATACIVFSLVMPVFAWDECNEIAKNGPNVPREEGKCEIVGQSPEEARKKPLDGLMQCKDRSGRVIQEARFRKGDLVSSWFYDYEDHKLSFGFDGGDKAHGPAKTFSKGGALLCEMNYVKGVAEGAVREYFPDGKLKNLSWFRNGKLEHAPRIGYSIAADVTYLACPQVSVTPEDKSLCGFNGKPVTVKVHGGFEDTVTHINGLLAEKIRFNRREGRTWHTVYPEPGNSKTYNEEELHKNGKLFRSFFVVNGKKEGQQREYADNGKLIKESEFKGGMDMVEKIYYMNGKLKEHSVRNPNGTSISTKGYWDNGRLKSDCVFAMKRRSSYGNTWTDTVPVGKALSYAEDGSLQEEANYDDEGNLDGARILVDEKGERTEAMYRKGTLVARKLFSAAGKLTSDEEYYEDGSRK